MQAASPAAESLCPSSGGVRLRLAAVAIAIFIAIAIAIMGLLGIELGQYAAADANVGGDETAERLLHQAGADAMGFDDIDDPLDLGGVERCVGKAHDRRRVDYDMIVGLKQLHDLLREAAAGPPYRGIA